MRTVEEIKEELAYYTEKQSGPLMKNQSFVSTIRELESELRVALTDDISLDRLSEICAAERDGRCAIPPCKVGAICYEIDPGHPGAIKHTVTGTTIYNRQADGNRYMTDFVNVIIIDTWAVAEDGCEWADQYTVAEWADAPKTRPEAEKR